jgi:hypothetical protein
MPFMSSLRFVWWSAALAIGGCSAILGDDFRIADDAATSGAGGNAGGTAQGASGPGGGSSLSLAHEWSMSFGDPDEQYATALAVDGNDQVVVGGYFRGVLEIGGDTLVWAGQVNDAFVAKFSPAGEALWARRYGSTDFYAITAVTDLAIDAAGNIYASGTFRTPVDFGASTGPLVADSEADGFLLKLNPNGATEWSIAWPNVGHGIPTAVALTPSGVVLAGVFDGQMDLGGGMLVAQGAADAFVASFDASGNHVASRRFGISGATDARDVAVDDMGNVFVLGNFDGSVDFGGTTLTNAGASDIFLAGFDAQLVHRFSHGYGTSGIESGQSLAIRGGSLVMAGSAGGPIDFGTGALPHGGSYDALLVELDTSGNHVRSYAAGDADGQHASGVIIEPDGSVLGAGSMRGAMSWQGVDLQAAGRFPIEDVWLARLDVPFAANYGDEFPQPSETQPGPLSGYPALASSPDGGIVMVGEFDGTIDFGGGPLVGQGESDFFVTKLRWAQK